MNIKQQAIEALRRLNVRYTRPGGDTVVNVENALRTALVGFLDGAILSPATVNLLHHAVCANLDDLVAQRLLLNYTARVHQDENNQAVVDVLVTPVRAVGYINVTCRVQDNFVRLEE